MHHNNLLALDTCRVLAKNKVEWATLLFDQIAYNVDKGIHQAFDVARDFALSPLSS